MVNPFHYGTPATGDNFVGRRSELQALLSRMRNEVNVVIISHRRYGKTSLLIRAEEVLARARPRSAVISTNVFLCKDLATLAGRLVAGLYEIPGARWHRARQSAVEFLRRLRVRPSVAFDDSGHPTFSFAPELGFIDADQVIADVYAALAAEATDRNAVLILDEFQAILRQGDHLPELLKGLSDQHPQVSLVLAGSQRRLMERLVTDQGAPLYGMAQRIVLGPIGPAEMIAYLTDRATVGDKPMDDTAAQAIVDLGGPVPNDIQHLAYEAFDAASGRITVSDVQEGLRRAVDHESTLFAERLGLFSPGQARVLVALAQRTRGPLFTSAFARTVGFAGAPGVKKAIDALAQDDTVVERDRTWVISDPFFAAWLAEVG